MKTPSQADSFIDALMEQIMEGVRIPKYQVERALSPILGVFIESIMSAWLRADVIMLAPEFPIRKESSGSEVQASDGQSSNTSTNIDWLMFDKTHNALVILELKTTDTTFRQAQLDIYTKLQQAIERLSGAFLLTDLQKIRTASAEHGKYEYVKNKLEQMFAGQAVSVLSQCRSAKVVYLAPSVSKPREFADGDLPDHHEWISFSELPENISTAFPEVWSVVRARLLTLDAMTRRQRNSKEGPIERGNFAGKVTIDDIQRLCERQGDEVVVGFDGGLKALLASDSASLRQRWFKWDHVNAAHASKDLRNWIPGSEFLRALRQRITS